MQLYNPQPPTGYTRITQYERDLYKLLSFRDSTYFPDQVIEISSEHDRRNGDSKWLWNNTTKLWERYVGIDVVAAFQTLQGVIGWYREYQGAV
jgi:hypothetical protein